MMNGPKPRRSVLKIVFLGLKYLILNLKTDSSLMKKVKTNAAEKNCAESDEIPAALIPSLPTVIRQVSKTIFKIAPIITVHIEM